MTSLSRIAALTAVATMVSSLLWAVHLTFFDVPWPDHAAALIAASLLVIGAVATAAIVLAPSRWVQVFVSVIAAAHLLLALAISLTPLWWLGIATSVAAAIAVWQPDVRAHATVDRMDRVPVAATSLALGLLMMPGLIGAAGWDGVTVGGWVLAGLTAALAWAYARALIPALWAARVVMPAISIWAVIGLPAAAAVLVLGSAIALTALAWTSAVWLGATALTPERAKAVPILPELVPPELMESAGFDDKGRPMQGRR